MTQAREEQIGLQSLTNNPPEINIIVQDVTSTSDQGENAGRGPGPPGANDTLSDGSSQLASHHPSQTAHEQHIPDTPVDEDTFPAANSRPESAMAHPSSATFTTPDILPEETSIISPSPTCASPQLQSTADTPVSESLARRCCQCTCKNKSTLCVQQKQVAIGFVLVTIGAACWTGVSQAARAILLTPSHNSPYLIVYFSTSCLVLIYPLSLLVRCLYLRGKMRVIETVRLEAMAFGEEDWWPCPYKPLAKCAAFTVLWDLAAYQYVRALGFKKASDVVALFATNSSFVYLMAWVVLQKRFIAIRIVAFIVGMTGAILLIYMEASFAGSDMWGSILVIPATATAAVHKVVHLRVFAELSPGQTCLVLSSLGLFNILTMWPILLLLYYTNAEPIDWNDTPWLYLAITALFVLGVTLVLSLGWNVVSDMVLQGVFTLAIPLTVVGELVLNNADFDVSAVQIGAYIIILISFLLNCLPNNWHQSLLKILHIKVSADPSEDAHFTPRQRLRHSTLHNNNVRQ